MSSTLIPNPGQIARVRQRLYLVEQIVPPPNAGDSTLVRLSCVDDDNQGQPLEVLWEREIDPEVLSGEAWESIAKRGFDPPKLFQWQEELENRFGLTFEILDKDYMKRVRRERGFAVNPWSTHSRFLISQRLLIDEAYVGPLRDWLGTFRNGSLLILDEAHHAAP